MTIINQTTIDAALTTLNTTAIGIMGGTFDPVHIGHLRAAVEFAQAFALSSVRLLPCHIPSHRESPCSSVEHRRKMLELAVASTDILSIDDTELKTEETSYTITTLRKIRAEIGEEIPLYFALGADAFNNIETWKEWQALFGLANFVVLHRPSVRLQIEQPELKQRVAVFQGEHSASGHIYELSITGLDISATQIRQLLKDKKNIQFLLPEAVENYIHQHQLYQ